MNSLQKTVFAVVLALPFVVSAQEAVVNGVSKQEAGAIGDSAYVGGSGSILFDHAYVGDRGSNAGGLLSAYNGGSALGRSASTYHGGVVGYLNIKATPGNALGLGGSEQYSVAKTAPGGVSRSAVGGKTLLFGYVPLPVDPTASAVAFDEARSVNVVGIPTNTSGFNIVQFNLSATMHH